MLFRWSLGMPWLSSSTKKTTSWRSTAELSSTIIYASSPRPSLTQGEHTWAQAHGPSSYVMWEAGDNVLAASVAQKIIFQTDKTEINHPSVVILNIFSPNSPRSSCRKLSNIAFGDMNPFPRRLLRNRRALHLEHLQRELQQLAEQQEEFLTEHAERKDKDLDMAASEDDDELWGSDFLGWSVFQQTANASRSLSAGTLRVRGWWPPFFYSTQFWRKHTFRWNCLNDKILVLKLKFFSLAMVC